MTFYTNSNRESAFASVEFTPVSDGGNFSFFSVNVPPPPKAPKDAAPDPQWEALKNQKTSEARQWLAAAGQDILAETSVNGKPILVAHGDRSQDDVLKGLAERGDTLKLQQKKKPFNMWAGRGGLSMVGQILQLISGYLQKGAPDGATITFALSNIAANISNIIFGSQKTEDLHKLRFLKGQINTDLAAYVASEDTLPSVEEKRAPLRSGPPEPETLGQKSWNVMQENSVRIGEIGLRYFGSVAMLFPMKLQNWKEAASNLFRAKPKEAYEVLRNTDKMTRYAGLAYVIGKTLGFASKVPDPYDPKPHTWVDTIREKVVFRASTLIEAVAASVISYDRIKNRTLKYPDKKFIPSFLRGKETRDYLGGIGGALFVGAFAMRFFAPFGIKQLDMEELHAHVTDSLAKTPPEKMPQLLAETVATLKENLKDQPVEYGELYTQIVTDLYRYQHKPIPQFNVIASDGTRKPAVMPSQSKGQQVALTGHALPERKSPMERVSIPMASHVEEAAKPAQPQLGLSA